MKGWRNAGNNHIYLIYLIRRTGPTIEVPKQMQAHSWGFMLVDYAYRVKADAFSPAIYAVTTQDEVIVCEQIILSFQPSVQGILVHQIFPISNSIIKLIGKYIKNE